MNPNDFEHVDCLDLDDDATFSVSLVKHPQTGRLYVEVLHGVLWGERYALAPLDVDPAKVDSWDDLAAVMGTEAGR